jgi:hypothetical protein
MSTQAACSALLAKPARDSKFGVINENCTTGMGLVGADVAIAVLQGIRTVIALSAPDSFYKNAPISREVDVTLGLGLAVGYGASAIYGKAVVEECRELKADRPPPRRVRLKLKDLEPATMPPPEAAPPQAPVEKAPESDGGVETAPAALGDAGPLPAAAPVPPVRQQIDPE